MDSNHPLKRAAAFASGGLAVAWIGGTVGAAGFKAVYWLIFGAWPETALYALAPAAAIRLVLDLPDGNALGPALLYLLHQDILTYILTVPPVLLMPCLALLLAGQGRPVILPRLPPFAAGKGGPVPRGIDPIFQRNRGLENVRKGI